MGGANLSALLNRGRVVPSHYDLDIRIPDPQAFVYEGKVDIELFVKESTDSISLNSKDIEIVAADSSVKVGEGELCNSGPPQMASDEGLEQKSLGLSMSPTTPKTMSPSFDFPRPFRLEREQCFPFHSRGT